MISELKRLALAALLLIAAACSSSTDTSSSPGIPTIGLLAGDGQTAIAQSPVPIAPAVVVTNANHQPLAGIVVNFAVKSGGGSVVGSTVSTDASGSAHVGQWILGPALGIQQLVASSSGAAPVTFTTTATLGSADSLLILSGDNQTISVSRGGTPGTLPASLSVRVVDKYQNPLPNVSVRFAPDNYRVNGNLSFVSVVSDASGVAGGVTWSVASTGAFTNLATLSATATGAKITTFHATYTTQ